MARRRGCRLRDRDRRPAVVRRRGDGVHDEWLDRLTDETGPINARTAAELGRIPLRHGDEGIPTLAEVVGIVEGKVPLLIEIKDQDGQMGPAHPAEEATAARCRDTPALSRSCHSTRIRLRAWAR